MRTLLLAASILLAMLIGSHAGLAAAPAAIALADDPVTLKYTWEKDKPLFYRITQETIADMSGMPGQPDARVSQSQTMRVRLDTTDIADDGAATVRATLEAVQFEMMSPAGERTTYDSEAETEPGARPDHPAARGMAAFVGESFTFQVTPNGEVRNVEGMDRILEKIAEEAGDPGMQDTFRGRFGNQAMEAMLEQGFKLLPDKAVEPGDTWTRDVEQPVPTLGTLRMESTMTLDRVEPLEGRQAARIPMTMTTTLDRSDVQNDELPPGMTISLEESKGEGTLLFDIDRGQVHHMEMVSRMPMRMTMQMGEESMTIRQDITSTVRMERVEDQEGQRPQTQTQTPRTEPAPQSE